MLNRVCSAPAAPLDVAAARRHTPKARLQIPAGTALSVLPPPKTPSVALMEQLRRRRDRRIVCVPVEQIPSPDLEQLSDIQSYFSRNPISAERLAEMEGRAKRLSADELWQVLLRNVQQQSFSQIGKTIGRSDQTASNNHQKIMDKLRAQHLQKSFLDDADPIGVVAERPKSYAGRPSKAKTQKESRILETADLFGEDD